MKRVPSPGSKRKHSGSKTFGVSLEELMKREPSTAKVPSVVNKICDFILTNGLEQEGIFRISGSVRVVDKIRTSFDKSGDANLTEDHDIMAVASSLKLFLRELPVPLVPETMTDQFLQLEEEYGEDVTEFITRLLPLLSQLPHHHYSLLSFLTYFLVKVACFESSNKMHANALAIVFGPNIFRCGAGISGLHDQATTNKVIHKLILHFDDIFTSPSSIHPRPMPNVIKVEETRSPRTPPPRPPPPKVGTSSPVSSPRRNMDDSTKAHLSNGSAGNGSKNSNMNNSSLNVTPISALKMISPRLSDDDSGRASPLILDSDNGHSIIESPDVPPAASKMVERTINKTIREHMFGDADVSTTASSIDDMTQENVLDSDTLVETPPTQDPLIKPASPPQPAPKPTSPDTAPKPYIKPSPPQRPTPPQKHISGVATLKTSTEQAASAVGVTDSRHDGNDSEESTKTVNVLIRRFQEQSHSIRDSYPTKLRKQRPHSTISTTPEVPAMRRTMSTEQARLRLDDDIHNLVASGSGKDKLDGAPRLTKKGKPEGKSVVPMLDFSALHQQINDQADARLAEKGFSPQPGYTSLSNSIPLHVDIVTSHKNVQNKIVDEAPLSPRAYQTPHDYSVPLNTDMPPSPPTNHDSYNTPSTEEYANALRQANKKIHSVKRKIKTYEDSYQKDHGHKPNLKEKTSNPEVKKYIAELTKHKKEIKRLKEEAGGRNRNNSGGGDLSDDVDSVTDASSIQATLDDLVTRLRNKRLEGGRPEDVTCMSPDQVQDEKLAVQKALLQFEEIHGRPSTREEKDVMRPLYDRYRTIKRILTKSMPVNVDPDLQTVPEDQPIDLDHHDTHTPNFRWASPVKVTGGTNDDFMVTRDLGLLRETMRPIVIENLTPDLGTPDDPDYLNSHLHHLSTPELREELESVNREKKELRKILRQYEDDFYRENGRKVQKEDRIPLSGEYLEYKRVKARLKLLEVLVSKR